MNEAISKQEVAQQAINDAMKEAVESTNYCQVHSANYHGDVCPHCGRCPTCGRGGYAPYWPYYPSYPIWTTTPLHPTHYEVIY